MPPYSDFNLQLPRSRRRLLDPAPESEERLATVRLFAILPFLVGVLILLGGSNAFLSPSLAFARSLFPFWLWALLLMANGFALFVVRKRHVRWLIVASGAFVWASYAVTFAVSAAMFHLDPPPVLAGVPYQEPSLYPIGLWAWISFFHARLAIRLTADVPGVLDDPAV